MAEFEHAEGIVHAKLSVALLAFHGNLADYISTEVLLVRNRDNKVSPVAGKFENPEGPFVALKREWDEETGGEPFSFEEDSLKFSDVIFNRGSGFNNIGFIYHGRLTDSAIRVFSKGKVITGDEDIVEAKLFNIDDVLAILRNWKRRLAYPEINAQTLINVVNNVMVNHDDYTGVQVKPENLFSHKDFGMNFTTSSLTFGV